MGEFGSGGVSSVKKKFYGRGPPGRGKISAL